VTGMITVANFFLKGLRTVLAAFAAIGFAILLALILPATAIAGSALPQGTKAISLVLADGTRQQIGHVTFTSAGDETTFDVQLDAPEFSDEFLSMRPFRCLSGTKEMWCHLAYPYELKRIITAADLTDLEYALLFLFKPPAGYGIDAWNGLYFKMALADDGAITGALNESDFNILASPPEKGVARPIAASGLMVVANDAHRFASIEIK
jgi:hypothetical protein